MDSPRHRPKCEACGRMFYQKHKPARRRHGQWPTRVHHAGRCYVAHTREQLDHIVQWLVVGDLALALPYADPGDSTGCREGR